MSKLLKMFLILSLAANVILLVGSATGYISIDKYKKASGDVAGGAGQSRPAGVALSPEAAKEAAMLLTTDDMAELRDRLRALGMTETLVREIVKARIASRHAARLREIGNAALGEARQTPYWRGKSEFVGGMSMIYTAGQQKEIDRIAREKREEARQVLGADADTASGYYMIRYAFFSPEKVAQLQGVERDYNDLKNQTIREMAGFRMPGDEAKLKLLDDEKQRDMQALLTPEEKVADDMRNSRTARQVQRVFAGFDGTEEEYKVVFALQNALEEKYPYNPIYTASLFGGADVSESYKARAEEQKNIDAQIKDMLGDARYAEYVRGQRQDYQTLQAAAQRFNLSMDTVAQTYQAREDAADGAKRISDDKSLDDAGKKEAYAALAAQATGQIRAALGDEVGDAYINNALGWLKNLPGGGAVKIDSQGNVSVTPPKPVPPVRGPARGQGGG